MDAGIPTQIHHEYLNLIGSDMALTTHGDEALAQVVAVDMPQNQAPQLAQATVSTVTVIALPSGVYSTELPGQPTLSFSQPLSSSSATSLISSTYSNNGITSTPPIIVASGVTASSTSSRTTSSWIMASSESLVTISTSSADSTTAIPAVVATAYSSGLPSTIPSSSSSESASSITSGSITNTTETLTDAAAVTVSASPTSKPLDSNLSIHNPPFYVGIVLGSIAAIAIVCALIAWCIRLRYARRRRAVETQLPWAQPDSDNGSLEAGRISEFNRGADTGDVQSLGNTENSQLWEIQGNRDVGEPKRDEKYGHVPGFLRDHHIPSHEFFSDGVGAINHVSQGDHPHLRKPTLRQLPSHLVDEKLSGQLHPSVPDRTRREYGTPREGVGIPRFLSLGGKGLDVPWHDTDSRPRSMVERLRRLSRPNEEGKWERLSPDSNESDKDVEAQKEGWTASITSNLVNAYNAVAANIPPFSAGGEEKGRDSLTPLPTKRSTARKSIRFAFDTDKQSERDDSTHSDTTSPKSPSDSDVSWTLEEKGDGVGVVHVHIPGLDNPGSDDYSFTDSHTQSTLSFGDGDDMMLADKETALFRPLTHESQTPLIASRMPPPALLRTDVSNHFRDQPGLGLTQVARNLSWNHDANSSLFGRLGDGELRSPTLPLKINVVRGRSHRNTLDMIKRPPTISRNSSSNSSLESACSTISNSSGRTTNDARTALRSSRIPSGASKAFSHVPMA